MVIEHNSEEKELLKKGSVLDLGSDSEHEES